MSRGLDKLCDTESSGGEPELGSENKKRVILRPKRKRKRSSLGTRRRSLPKEDGGLSLEEAQRKVPTMAEQLTRAGLGLVVSAVGITQFTNKF